MKKFLLSFLFLSCFTVCSYSGDVKGEVRTYKVGKISFIAIRDMDTNMGKEILLKPEAEVVKRVMPDNQNPSSINTFLLKVSGRNILIDTGIGQGGSMLTNISIAGVEPESVNAVIITHMHGDHIGGLISSEGNKVFENAVVYVNTRELDYWINSTTQNPGNSALAKAVQSAYGDKLRTFEWGTEIIPEIKAVKAPGHTPGHTAFEINSDGETMLVIGDLTHSMKVQMADPNMAVTFDTDPRQAVETRKKIFKEVSSKKTRIAGMHIPFPGVGTLSETSKGYLFSPSVSIN
jgi:Zn-dependent hydrolases, including glyoxylases